VARLKMDVCCSVQIMTPKLTFSLYSLYSRP
jgi:hypothetical protein